MRAPHFVLLCRAGFESECGQEIVDHLGQKGVAAGFEGARGAGAVQLVFFGARPASERARLMPPLQTLIFSRQLIEVIGVAETPDSRDRVSPILSCLQDFTAPLPWSSLEVMARCADENEDLQRFVRRFASPMANALRRAGQLSAARTDAHPLIVIFSGFDSAILGQLLSSNRAKTVDGVPRLKFPADAPSRSTLKLEEAWHTFLASERWYDYLGGGKLAVDLGAAPGGWTWQLVQQGMEVVAVDNGEMDSALMKSGQVIHLRADGFTFRPSKRVDWMVCDMVEQPSRVLDLVADWFEQGFCRYSVFNLKLPMKKRYQEVVTCLDRLQARLQQAGLNCRVRARQLYHDREEITCFVESLS